MTSSSRPRYFGISTRGPHHQHRSEANQDAWLGCSRAYGTLIAVGDGLGSRSQSGWGALQACFAVRDALRYWHTHHNSSPDTLLKLIGDLWECRVQPAGSADCATTCLFAAVLPTGQFIAAGLGDGLIAVREPDGAVHNLVGPRDGFSNQTKCLSGKQQPDDWQLCTFEAFEPEMSVILATDGVADDLITDRLGDFMVWLVDEHGELPALTRHFKLLSELRNWPTPRHVDDKTIAVMYKPQVKGSEL